MLSRIYDSLIRISEKIHDPKRPGALVLSRRAFTRAMGLVAFGGFARPASPRVLSNPLWPTGSAQVPLMRGEVELVIGGILEGEPEYLFEEVRALARDAEGMIYAADSGPRMIRVFDSNGTHVRSFGGPGRGPGEFRIWRLCGLAFDPDGRLWVNQMMSFEIFRVGASRVEFVESFVVDDSATGGMCGNPMFAGPTGITVPRRGLNIMGAKDEHVQVTEDGEVRGRVPNVPEEPDFGEWDWPVIVLRNPGLGTNPGSWPTPFAARVLVAHAPDGGFAQVFSPVYDIRIHGPDSTQIARVRRDQPGPLLTEAEAREVREWLEQLRDGIEAPGGPELVEWPDDYRLPARKPVFNHIWYDEDGRLWVCLWPAEGDSMYRAHVYDANGAFLHEAEWPRNVAIWYGGVRGDVALGVRTAEFEVEQVVRLRFRPVAAPDPPGER